MPNACKQIQNKTYANEISVDSEFSDDNWYHSLINRLLMVHGSWLTTHGWWPIFLGHEPWALSHEPWGMGHEPGDRNYSPWKMINWICKFPSLTVSKCQSSKVTKSKYQNFRFRKLPNVRTAYFPKNDLGSSLGRLSRKMKLITRKYT